MKPLQYKPAWRWQQACEARDEARREARRLKKRLARSNDDVGIEDMIITHNRERAQWEAEKLELQRALERQKAITAALRMRMEGML